MNDWLIEKSRKLAAATNEEPKRYTLDEDVIERLLDLARIAAHDSGERVTAPLLCYLLGLAGARTGKTLEQLAHALEIDPKG